MCVWCVCIDLIQHASTCFPGYQQNHLMALVLFCQKARWLLQRASTERVSSFEAMHINMLFLSFSNLSTLSVSLASSHGKILPR